MDRAGSLPNGDAGTITPATRPMTKHTILFLSADPRGADQGGLDRQARRGAFDEEASAIRKELERSGSRDRFELVTRWAAEPQDLLRELRVLKPTVVHFRSG